MIARITPTKGITVYNHHIKPISIDTILRPKNGNIARGYDTSGLEIDIDWAAADCNDTLEGVVLATNGLGIAGIRVSYEAIRLVMVHTSYWNQFQ